MCEMKWIQCSDKLPVDGEEILFSVSHNYGGDTVYYGFFDTNFDKNGEFIADRSPETFNVTRRLTSSKVLAWMPLPKPYKIS